MWGKYFMETELRFGKMRKFWRQTVEMVVKQCEYLLVKMLNVTTKKKTYQPITAYGPHLAPDPNKLQSVLTINL